MSTGTLLGVWAHPDDEAYLSAGLMAAARRSGDRVVVVTATAGEHGTNDPTRWPPHRLGARRRRELRASLAILGVREHHVLGHPDGGCANEDGSAAIASIIRDVRPNTIVTFGPEGMTGHPDHRAVSAWTAAAVACVESTARVWHATVTPEFHDRWGQLNDRIGLWSPEHAPPCVDAADLTHVVRLGGAALEQKLAALHAHASQTRPLVEIVGAAYRHWWSTEAFVDASAQVTRCRAPARGTERP